MANYKDNGELVDDDGDFLPDWVSPPGDTIERIIKERNIPISEFAQTVDLSLHEVQLLLIGKWAIDKVLAGRLSSLLGSTQSFWLKREAKYRSELIRLKKSP